MKKEYLLLAIVLLLAVVVVAGVDFSGTWAVNADKTTAANPAPPAGGGGGGGGRGGGGMGGGRGGGGDLTIKQVGNVLTISRTTQNGTVDTPYTMDGADHTNTTQAGDMKYKAELSGSSVHITGTQPGRNGEQPIDLTYTLSDDGKTLTSANVMQTQNGAMTRKTVYDKK